MRVPASPLLVFGFASAAWAAPASPALGGFRSPSTIHSPAMQDSPAFAPAPSPAPSHAATFGDTPTIGGSGGDAFTGQGGQALGGNKVDGWRDGLVDDASVLDIASNDAGDGGIAHSGTAIGGDASESGRGGNAYSGPGGKADGGNKHLSKERGLAGLGITDSHTHWSSGADHAQALDILSGSAGSGGDASSCDARGGDAGIPHHQIDSHRAVVAREREMRRSRQAQGLGLGNLGGLKLDNLRGQSDHVKPIVEELKNVKLM